MQARIYRFFEGLVESGLSGRLEGFDQREEGISFTLPALYRQLFSTEELSYRHFRSVLYSSELNQRLAKQGVAVGILHSSNKVDKNIYYLHRL
ncbi:hypothetical protein EDC56_0417 [Sinobacterium caligoides]|uniref:Uncharacterized protein n=1 Tax=Sinobacterium caligoides TaxID=933926 RepID=A0A3N2DYI1_9GAMM|nr:hypothetical protein EDC56_0417 [Sinobacterium caligoides]